MELDLTLPLFPLFSVFASSKGEGYTTYRLRRKDGRYIHMQSRGFLEYNVATKQVETFLCINTMLTDENGKRSLEEQKKRFTPYILEVQKQKREENDTVELEKVKTLPGFLAM